MRSIVGWTGLALFYLGGAAMIITPIWYFARLTRAGLRATEIPGLLKSTVAFVALAAAVSVLGMGVAVASIDSAVLVPIGLTIALFGAWIGIYGVQLYRTRSDAGTAVQFRQLTSRVLMLGQIVALVGLIPILGVYFFLNGQRAVGLVLIGGPLAFTGALLQRLMDSLLARPLLPRAFYRFLTIGGLLTALTGAVEMFVRE